MLMNGLETNLPPAGTCDFVVPEGTGGELHLKVNSLHLSGPKDLRVRIQTDQPSVEELAAHLVVEPLACAEPSTVYYDDVDWKEGVQFTVRIRCRAGVALTKVLEVPESLNVTLSDEGGGEWLLCGGSHRELRADEQGGTVKIGMDRSDAFLKIPVRWSFRKVAEITPGRVLSLGNFRGDLGTTSSVKVEFLEGYDTTPCEVSASWNLDGNTCGVRRKQGSGKAVIDLDVCVASGVGSGLVRGKIDIATGHPHVGTIHVMVIGRAL
jgi:hypothetical protein